MKIGLISDTHSAGSGRDLPRPVLDALAGVDLVLHCGDLECLGVLDYLESVAPVLAVRGYEDPREDGGRLADTTRVVRMPVESPSGWCMTSNGPGRRSPLPRMGPAWRGRRVWMSESCFAGNSASLWTWSPLEIPTKS